MGLEERPHTRAAEDLPHLETGGGLFSVLHGDMMQNAFESYLLSSSE